MDAGRQHAGAAAAEQHFSTLHYYLLARHLGEGALPGSEHGAADARVHQPAQQRDAPAQARGQARLRPDQLAAARLQRRTERLQLGLHCRPQRHDLRRTQGFIG